MPPLLKAHPVAGQYFLNSILAVARIDFFGPARGGLNLDPNLKFNEKMQDAITAALEGGQLAALQGRLAAAQQCAADILANLKTA